MCVVGGGIAGTSAALHLVERGFDVVLLEAQHIGWGASGRSGAQVLPGVATAQDRLERLLGYDDARAVWDVSVAGVRLVRELIERHAIDAQFVAGHMLTAVKPRHTRELRAYLEELQRRYDYAGVRYMAQEEVRSVVSSTRYLGALYDSNAGHIHPLNYTQGLAAAAERLGVRIFEGTHAVDFDGRAPVRVRTPTGDVRCRQLLLCGNVYLGRTAPQLQTRIMAVGTCIVASEPLEPERAQALITNNAAVADMNWVLDYFRRSIDHRLLFGGRVTYAGFDPDRIAAATRLRMVRVFPQLKDVKVEFAWGGYVDITRNRAPRLRTAQSGRVLSAGFLGPRHRPCRYGRQAGERGNRGRCRPLRCLCAHSPSRFSGWPGIAAPGAGAGDAVLAHQRPALARADLKTAMDARTALVVQCNGGARDVRDSVARVD
ncbi:MAG: FAD-binding oxidoreductase [Steroidobacteraceae bacterium]